ncbi:CLUMA_CG012880, isoform B [Clunio marinus]|uniref:CLUMA_CG012880, isoform B n=1 Tax=Clunio marinus TaxID=568069 RepID=A0A1J1IH29_9DIPT|nr:CLUMA_CG012880, isoform B [Clunio marinus]
MRVLLLLLFSFYCLQGCYGSEVETKSVIRGQSTTLTCPIDITNCGELHSIKWFKGSERIGVASGDGKFSQVEGSISDRLAINYSPGRFVKLDIKSIQIDDEDTYSCEVTYLEPLETCDTTGEYQTNVNVVVPPSSIQMKRKDDTLIRNGTTIGPLKEGHRLEMNCEVRGARPQPTIGWYRGGRKLPAEESVDPDDFNRGLFTVNSKLKLSLSRQELGKTLECRVKTTDDDPIISNQLFIDLEVRPTEIHLDGVKSHVVEGSRVLLQCHVLGARPAANISWYNSSKLIDDSNKLTTISTTASLQSDGTFETSSQLIFTATRFENDAMIRCEADNIVMRNDMDKPLQQFLSLEVMYPPVVRVTPENMTINETGEFLLFCSYDANPASLASIRWLQNNSVINLNQSRFDGGHPEQTALLVKNATRYDIGSYSCELTNQVGTGTSENGAVIDVQYKPTVTIRFEPTSPIIENDHVNVTLHCDVNDGNPRKLLKVQWMIDGMVLTELPECNEDSFDDDADDDEDEDDDDEGKSRKNQNYFCFIDPTKILLQNVNREFLGNYSCRGFNAAGWGDESESKLLDIFYEPGNASISVDPPIPLKGKSMELSCSVEDSGNPKSTRFHWLRGDEPVKDIVTSIWTIDPVILDSRNNFSCYAFNDGGNGTLATIYIDVQVAPSFINNLSPYTGFLYSEPNVMLSCRVECVPECSIFWFRDGNLIDNNNPRYYIKKTMMPADTYTGDFESVLSELYFNISAWPNHRLDSSKDSANYSCSSSNNSVGLGVRSVTSFGVEYPPENVTITPTEVQVVEGKTPAYLLCSASAHPNPQFHWKRFGSNDVLMSTAALKFTRGLNRTDKGVYSCIVENKHGSNVANITMNILYAPNCTITRSEEEGDDTLICVADGNPTDYKYEWDFKSENETENESFDFEIRDTKSYLRLGDVPNKRVYYCRANNSVVDLVGPGSFCEITVEGHLMWYQKPLAPLIIVAILVGCLIAVIILICIIICMCRRRRKRSSKSMEKSLVDTKPNDPNAAPCENYENLPFHGLQSPPTKFNYLTAPANNLNVNLVHHQQKPFVSHPYSEHYYYESSNNNNRTYNSSTPNSTIRSVKNYRKPHPPVGSALHVVPTNVNYNVVMNTSTPNSSYQATNPLTNNLNHSYNNTNSHKYSNNNVSQNNNLNHSNVSYQNKKIDQNNTSNLSRRSSQSSSSHEWMSEKPHSLSLCINRINLKKSNKNTSSSGAQFQSMRCRKHRNRNHFFNTSTTTSYQKYKLTKSCSNDTVNSDKPSDPDDSLYIKRSDTYIY